MATNYPLNLTKNVIMRINKGFTYLGKPYGWHDNQLYRLPYSNGMRYYTLLKCKPWLKKGYILGNGVRKSFGQLESMTTDIDVTVNVPTHPDTPF